MALKSSTKTICKIISYVIIGIASAKAAIASDKPVLTLNSSNVAPFSNLEATGLEDLLAKEIYGRLGYNVKIVHVPAKRGLLQVNSGKDDGSIARNPNMSRKYPNMVQFNEPALTREYVAFTTEVEFDVKDWSSLAPFEVGIVSGWKVLEENITQYRTLQKVANGETIFKMLSSGRFQVAVFNRWGGYEIIRRLGLKNVKPMDPAFLKRPVYFYLNKRHADLVSKADKVLKQMKKDGTYAEIYDQTVSNLDPFHTKGSHRLD